MANELESMGRTAKHAALEMAQASSDAKQTALEQLASLLLEHEQEILAANQLDLEAAEAAGMSPAMLDRLSLRDRVKTMASDVRAIAAYPDPIGEIVEERELTNGLHLSRRLTPIGVLGVIYEARPNVTIDVAALAIKTGNCAILRGGKEALQTNQVLADLSRRALAESALPLDAVQLVSSPSRKQVAKMVQLHNMIDLIIPRGGAELHAFCRENSKIPVITGGVGVCHLFVDESADAGQVVPVIVNAKVQRPTVCNALDTLLVHRNVARAFLPELARALAKEGVSPCCDGVAEEILKDAGHTVRKAQEEDWDREWLSLVLGIKVVDGLEEAIAHVQRHSTGHSDGILTRDAVHADRFVKAVDSAAVYVNASTRFTDGAQFGLGAEVAVSTQKIHARGPMGVRALTSYKWVIHGDNQVRE